jgi:large conductance mechanosensitive channel
MKIIDEFKEFAVKGNVVDMAVGVIIGAGFGKIVTSFLNDLMMPPLSLLGGTADFSDGILVLRAAEGANKAVTLNYGNFITTVLDFGILAFAVFMLVKGINTLKKSQPVPPPAPSEKQCAECLLNIPLKAKRCGHCASPQPAA